VDDARSRWNRRHETETEPAQPSAFLVSLEPILPTTGRVLDVAGGTGRNALWLAARGLDVTMVDVSDVALRTAAATARRQALDVTLVEADLEREPLPVGPWDLVVCIHYLQRTLFPTFSAALAPGGLLVCEVATLRNLERHERPPRPFLLEEGEAPALVPDLEIVHYSEGWMEDDRHQARLVARRPPGGASG
jgi:SAM-dependent methyltransferase